MRSLSLWLHASLLGSLSWRLLPVLLFRCSGEVSVDVLHYDPCLGAVSVVGVSIDKQMVGQVMRVNSLCSCRHSAPELVLTLLLLAVKN